MVYYFRVDPRIEAISIADPSFGVSVVEEMYRPPPAPAPVPSGALDRPYVRILEQPAGKSLRFRYECEGRSAGSIPGASSTPERKTYPTIEVCGYKGRFVVLVSCVTKDRPYRPHPHNLVGREPACSRGVCTVEMNGDSSTVQFSNLGIQCVKRKDIAEALRAREEMKVDPFKTGFGHKTQPQQIDLNAVRLCFQVYIPGEKTSKIKQALHPVVSDVIYDKKAMCELQINRISTCAGSVKGGTELILLCEKVTREDIEVVFSQKFDDGYVWESAANILLVHKQVAIAFQAPPYRDLNCTEHVKVQICLRRISDQARSTPVDFEYTPDFAGTRNKPLPDPGVLALLLAGKPDTNNNDKDKDNTVSSSSDSVSVSVSDESGSATIADLNGNIIPPDNEKSLNELLDQVAELDEIYTENRTRLQNVTTLETDDVEDFNDAGTYTSLQLAFRNPVLISEPETYEDVQVQTYRGPIIEFAPLKRDTDEERAPPLPPKRVRKAPSVEGFKTSQTSVNSFLKPGKQLPITRNLDTSRTELSVARSEPALPPAPKKRSFLSRLFRRKEKSPAPSVKSEGPVKKSKPVGRSVSSVSGHRPSKFKTSISHTSLKDNASGTGLSYADSVTHISLHGDENEKNTSQTRLSRPSSLAPLPPTDGDTILVAESVLALDASQFKKLQDDLDLTDAEHYALYMAVAPHATVSEFDETSCYYSPVDGSKFQN
ncbi:embryonic polarity protein dorsal-like isoform X2 [Choristoneura fumiferana]|uniref:embryonic polarity protein dorsal-like isoform X2 n=1 Tax=Choristoneura fumiferana TaxID=7141 RepID=UPI003D1542DB